MSSRRKGGKGNQGQGGSGSNTQKSETPAVVPSIGIDFGAWVCL